MKRLRLFWNIVRRCHFDKILIGFIISFFVVSLIIPHTEPGIKNFGDGIWYMFVASTTIGFGDMVAVSVVGRILTIFITLYEIVLVALLSGAIVSYYLEVMHRRENESITMFMDKLEHLSELSKEELIEIEEKVKRLE